jgi:phosphatidylserine/phosphatidylglycerophosphate/cardiolipin synthase-like enzyme
VDRDPADVADLVTLFEADWTRSAPAIECTRMIVSPINARERILELIASAESTLAIESMQFADTEVREAVAARITAGVEVRVLLADADWIDANAGAATFLKDRGVTVKWIPHLHTKAIVADGARAYVGSENLSWTSLTKNREVGVIVGEASSIAPIVDTFEQDWAAGTSF